MLRRTLAGTRIPHVCIVGAGVSGLRCADVLLQHGVTVTILEARNRVGGRLCQGTLAGRTVDLGPNWIHGTDNNPILDLARDVGSIATGFGERQTAYDEQGRRISDEETATLSAQVWGIIADAFQHSSDHAASIPPTQSLMDFVDTRVRELHPDAATRTRILRFAEMWGAFIGSPARRQSLRFMFLEESLDGENLFVADTYAKVLDRIAAPATAGARIRFNEKVTRVTSQRPSDVAAVEVETERGSTETFDEVVVTTPLGWLKRNQHVFSPPLPSRLSRAIDSLGYGTLDKVYITFRTAYWDAPSGSRLAPSPIPSAPNPAMNTTPGASLASVERSHHPDFTHWMHPTYDRSTNPTGGCQEMGNLAALPPGCAHPTLLFYIFGPVSAHVSSLIADAPDRAGADAAVLRFFAPYYSRLPHYDAASPDCAPVGVLATNWVADELAGHGSYSNFPVGSDALDRDVETMRHGLPERGVWLAGEHTAPFVALGTVTGAYWSGEAVARRIAQAYQLDGDGSSHL